MSQEKEHNIRSAVLLWFMTAVYMAVIFFLSSRSVIRIPLHFDHIDKVIHTLIYMPLAFLFYITLRRSGIRRYIFMTAFILTALYGVSDEVHQHYVAGRDASVADACADVLGALLGSLGAAFLKQ